MKWCFVFSGVHDSILNNNSTESSWTMSSHPVDIVIPVYNEEESLPEFYEQLSALPIAIHPIFIDNGSTDNSLDFVKSIEGATVICHGKNMGYGASLRTGIEHATAEKIIIIDADGEYTPSAIPAIIRALDKFDVVHTSRFLEKKNRDMSSVKYYGNKIITSIFNVLFRQALTDLYTGCKGYRRQAVANLEMRHNGFEHVLEVSARLVRRTVTISEIPIRYKERKRGVSKMNHFFETFKYICLVVYYFFALDRQKGSGQR